MSKLILDILYLYPDEMSFYGDSGNVVALKRRMELRGMAVNVHAHRIGEQLPETVDIVVGGGGQDEGQLKIYDDLQKIGEGLQALADQDVPMVMICGLYQLFGKRFVTQGGKQLDGIGIFDLETIATDQRLIGNIITESEFGELVGFENHSGQTILAEGQPGFGKIKVGYGNDSKRQYDGAVYKNVFGTYLHGAVLPKNPKFADAVLARALLNRYGRSVELSELSDALVPSLHKEARKRGV